jgi:hypothetical protein
VNASSRYGFRPAGARRVASRAALGILLLASSVLAERPRQPSTGLQPLTLSLSQQTQHGPQGPQAQGRGAGRGAHAGAGDGDESEHVAVPLRRYLLNAKELAPSAATYVLRPDGTIDQGRLISDDDGIRVEVETSTAEPHEPVHGANSVYVIDRQLADGARVVRTAKWVTIHHSCRWGHPYKHQADRQILRGLPQAELDVLGESLWDGNFHIKTASGDDLVFQVLLKGAPIAGAAVTVRSEKGWVRQLTTDAQGKVSVQMVQDSFAGRWDLFNRDKRGRLFVTASYEYPEVGTADGQPYERVKLVTTMPWRYAVPRSAYTSQAWGLGITLLVVVTLGSGVFLYRERRKAQRARRAAA